VSRDATTLDRRGVQSKSHMVAAEDVHDCRGEITGA
jgi:hypothetical protein